MTRWLVRVKETRAWTVEVEAGNVMEAETNAVSASERGGVHVVFDPIAPPRDVRITAHAQRQLGEPWVSGAWYDVNCDDVLVCTRSYGNDFTKAEITVLRHRLRKMGLRILDSWNGEGTGSVSFRCRGRNGNAEMTESERAVLCAPLKEQKT